MGSQRVGHEWLTHSLSLEGSWFGMQDLVLWSRIKPGPLHWDLWVLTTGPPEESPIVLITYMLVFSNFKIPWTKYSLSVGQLFPNGSVGKKSTCNAGDTGDGSLIPGSGRSPGGGNGNPLQYSCWDNTMNRRAINNTQTKELSSANSSSYGDLEA